MKPRKADTAVRWIIIGAAIFAAVALAVGVFWFSRPMVTVTRVVEGPVVESFYATGTIEPVTEFPIKASNAGIIQRVLVDKGDHVTAGQPLAVVEDPQLQFKLDKAKAELNLAKQRADDSASPVLKEFDDKIGAMAAMLENAKREEKSMGEMFNKKAASRSDWDKAADHVKDMWSQGESLKSQRKAMQLQLQTDLRIAEASVAAAQREADLQTLISPIDGVVLDRPTPLGTRLNINDHLMQIADVRVPKLVMRAAVDEENVASLRLDQPVRMALYSFPGRAFEGRVTKIYDKADPDRRTFEVDVKLLQPDAKLAAGMTGELAFILKERDGGCLIAPAQALQGGALYAVRDGRLVRVPDAQVGAKSVERIELQTGFKLGDWVVISPVQGIRDGSPVRVTIMAPTAAADLNKPKTDSVFKGFN